MVATPWTAVGTTIEITRAALDAVEADAVRGYNEDAEACGYLVGGAGDARCDEHQALENRANKLHEIDPETYFRTARTFFAFNEKKFDNAVKAGAEKGRPVKVLYHSHLDAGAYFSPTDRAVLSFGKPPETEGGAIELGPGPQWPLAFLVTSVMAGNVDAHQCYVWSAEKGDFVETPMRIID